ncbi:MAG: hypothetical protein HY744_26000 [Deltaproteobacteria bacterium]|nr:hypothetical protein [Deltaproteobacteria bacterium]
MAPRQSLFPLATVLAAVLGAAPAAAQSPAADEETPAADDRAPAPAAPPEQPAAPSDQPAAKQAAPVASATPPAPAAAKPAAPAPAPGGKPAAGAPAAPPVWVAHTPAVGAWVERPIFPEERPPPYDAGNADALRLGLHGYFRAPLRMSWKPREETKEDESGFDLRTPWLVDDDYLRSGFVYTPVNEPDYTELYFQAGNQYLTGTVALMGSLYSDPARPIIDRQLGIAQGYLTLRYEPGLPVKTRIQVKGGAFSDRFGWLEKYDTYIFGRTHQMGEQVRLEVDAGDFTFSALEGFGVHLEAIESNQGLSLLTTFGLAAAYGRYVELGLYHLHTWSQDKRQLKELTDASMRVVGADLRADGRFLGRLYLATSVLTADAATFLAPSIEVMHALGGRGITENYLGTEKSKNGTGGLWNIGFQYDYSVATLLGALLPGQKPLGGGDITLGFFGAYAYVGSEQSDPDPLVNRDERKYFKHGFELGWWALPWLGTSLRYDRLVPDTEDEPSSFRILSPRLGLRTHWYADALIFVQWSHYFYGERVALRPGQVALETEPDKNVLKIQAQLAF